MAGASSIQKAFKHKNTIKHDISNKKFDLVTEYYYDKNMVTLREINQIRRVLYRDIPTMAISEVRIIRNTTYVTEEEILQALAFVLIKDKKCKLDSEEIVRSLKLKIVGPKLVLVSDLTHDEPIELLDSEAPLFFVDFGELILTATARKGNGLEHAAFFPVNTVYISIDPDMYKFTIESSGKRSVYEIYTEALTLIT